MASRGDRIRCTVMFEDVKEREDGKKEVPIRFTLNGKRILVEGTEEHDETDCVFMDYDDDKPLYPYISMTDGCSVLAKVIKHVREISVTKHTLSALPLLLRNREYCFQFYPLLVKI